MTTRQRYVRPEIHEVLLDVSQAVLAACKSGTNNAKDRNKSGYCTSTCKMSKSKTGSNSSASS